MTYITNEAKKYIEANKQGSPYYTLSAAEARASRQNLTSAPYSTTELASITNTTFTARDGAHIQARIYTPTGQGPFPIIVYYHGGGWVFGNLESTDGGCQLLAVATQSIVVSIDYRLAPEYKFPTPLHDAYDGLLWVHAQAEAWNGLAQQIVVAGDSAGGNLATVVAILARDLKGPTISAQTLIYPVTDMSKQAPSYETYGEHYGLDTEAMQWFASHYSNEQADLHNPLISPLLTADFSGLPKTLIIAAEADVLFDEGVAYAKKLQAANVPTQHLVLPGLIHSYFSKMAFFEDETKKTAKIIADFLHRA